MVNAGAHPGAGVGEAAPNGRRFHARDRIYSLTRSRFKEKAARDSQSKADAIGATVFDLKAVNPNVVVKLDTRTPQEVIQSIQTQAAIVAQSLQSLQSLLTASDQTRHP